MRPGIQIGVDSPLRRCLLLLGVLAPVALFSYMLVQLASAEQRHESNDLSRVERAIQSIATMLLFTGGQALLAFVSGELESQSHSTFAACDRAQFAILPPPG